MADNAESAAVLNEDAARPELSEQNDPRACGWMGCQHPRCERTCTAVPLNEWRRWRGEHDYVSADLQPRHPDRHRSLFRRLWERAYSSGQADPS